MTERRGPWQAASLLLASLARLRMRMVLAAVAVFFIAAIWIIVALRIDSEYLAERDAVLRQNANLTRAFEEGVRHEIQAIDDILRFLRKEYEGHGSVTLNCFANTQNIDLAVLNKILKSKHHLVIDGGYGKLKGKTFRISNMGNETAATMNELITAMDDVLV